MFYNNLAGTILFNPLTEGMNELTIITGYATPNMLSWYIKNLEGKNGPPITINLVVGMVSYDNLSVSVHEGFNDIVASTYPGIVNAVKCSYVFDNPAVHSNLFIWSKAGAPKLAFMGSAHFLQSTFVGNNRQDTMEECNPDEAMDYYQSIVPRTVYCNHAEVEELVVLQPTHSVLDVECNLAEGIITLATTGIESVVLSLLSRNGKPGARSGLNWGQRDKREPNQAYIHLPRKIATSGFFPLNKQHFTAVTDDRHQLILRVEQENDKAITTPARNSDLGEYFRNRLGLANGAYVTKDDLDRYGRTDVTFYKLDDETFYMDFSI